jgi:hypothetical protein
MASSGPQTSIHAKPLISTELTGDKSVSEPLGRTALYATQILHFARLGLGLGSVLAPHFTCGLFKFYISNETSAVVRMFGIREIAIAALTKQDKTHSDGGRRELRKIIWENVSIDLMDVVSVGFAVANGHMGRLPGALLAGGAVIFAGTGLVALRNL